MTIVVDASVSLSWLFDDETSPYSDSALNYLRHAGATVSAIWPLEIANAIILGIRRGRLSVASARYVLSSLEQMPITVDAEALTSAWTTIIDLGQAYGLTAYDASYLDLAMRTGFPLATLDKRLREAAGRSGVPLFDPTSQNGRGDGSSTPGS